VNMYNTHPIQIVAKSTEALVTACIFIVAISKLGFVLLLRSAEAQIRFTTS